jgi:ERF superfamily
MSVHKKLMNARIMMMKAKLEKTGKNSFAGYKYFELGDFLPAVQLIFEQLGLCGIVSYDNEYASLCITDTDDGTTVRITSPMASAQLKGAHDIQNLGAVETYQRRYLWMTAMELVENDPIDSSPPIEKPKEVLQVTEKPKYKVENPKPTMPKESKEFPGLKEIGVADPMVEWQIKIGEGDWKEAVMEATKMTIELTKTPEDVQSIYRVNKSTYERLKTEFPVEFTELLDLFKARKEALK